MITNYHNTERATSLQVMGYASAGTKEVWGKLGFRPNKFSIYVDRNWEKAILHNWLSQIFSIEALSAGASSSLFSLSRGMDWMILYWSWQKLWKTRYHINNWTRPFDIEASSSEGVLTGLVDTWVNFSQLQDNRSRRSISHARPPASPAWRSVPDCGSSRSPGRYSWIGYRIGCIIPG